MSSDANAFVAFLSQNLPAIESYVHDSLPRPSDADDEATDLGTYLFGPLERFVASGGKRVRPALCLLGARAVGGTGDEARSVAAAVELFQAAALIHDDIADNSELRRGVPCLHVSEGTGLAVNAGDAALVAVSTCIMQDSSLDSPTKIRLLGELLDMENRTLEGQALDLGWARDGRWDILVADYLAMARRKTAYYSAAVPLAMGAICGGGTTEQVEGLRAFGMRCGLAFQVQDDLLNLVGDAAKQGKDYRSDITEGKRTLIVVWALEHLEQADHAELVDILSSHTTNPAQLDRAVELMTRVGALDHAQTFCGQLVKEAKAQLEQIPIAADARDVLRSMADFFIERRS